MKTPTRKQLAILSALGGKTLPVAELHGRMAGRAPKSKSSFYDSVVRLERDGFVSSALRVKKTAAMSGVIEKVVNLTAAGLKAVAAAKGK